jgi:hypothetical protein
MKWISCLGSASALVLAGTAALAQDFTAGKTPAQLFGSDCSECHRSPAGLAKNRDVRTLAGFLRQHYTTKADNATSLAAYVGAFSGAAPPPQSPARRAAAPPRRDADADVAHADPRTREEPPLRRRPPVNLSGEGEKRPPQEDAGPQRSPALPGSPGNVRAPGAPASNGVRETALARPQRGVPRGRVPVEEATGRPGTLPGPPGMGGLPDHARFGVGAATPGEAADSLSRLKAYVTSGQDIEAAAADAAKIGSGNVRPRRENAVGVAPEVPLGTAAEGGTEAPAAAGDPSVMPAPALSTIPPAALADPTAGVAAVREPISSAPPVPDAATAPAAPRTGGTATAPTANPAAPAAVVAPAAPASPRRR